MAVLVGLDGGGTKTEIVVAGRGARLAQVRVAGSSLSRRTRPEVEAELAAGLAAALHAAGATSGDCAAGVGGFASAAGAANAAAYSAMLQRLLPRAQVRVTTDAEIALLGASGGADGIVVIAGTGSIAWGRYAGRVARAGGAGPGNDPGSADWLGREAVAAGLAEEPDDGNYAALVRRLAPATPADGPLARLLAQAGRELAALLQACARQLEWESPRAYAMGGMLEQFAAARAALAEAWPHPLLPPQGDAVEGALALARALAGGRV
jgi:glucosamine kinase